MIKMIKVKSKEKFIFIKKIYLFLLLLTIFLLFGKNNVKIIGKNYPKQEEFSLLDNNISINGHLDFFKYQKMLPHLTPNFNSSAKNVEEIFSARQLYISDTIITPEYIKYIRPIKQNEENNYKHNSLHDENIIDMKLLKKRVDQYNYKEFCNLSLSERLIDNISIQYKTKPIISIIIPSYNKQDILLKSVRSIQNQNLKNLEIIIVNDCSNDNSTKVFNYLLETDPRIRIFHHMTNLGLFRSRIDGILYSKGKYIIAFDAGDLYEDNYVLYDAYNVIEKYNLDSCKFLFRQIKSFNDLYTIGNFINNII